MSMTDSYHHSRGNAVIIILISVALFAALTFTLTKSMRGGHSSEITQASIEQHTSDLLTYAATAESVVEQMLFNGSTMDTIDPILPSDVNFEVGEDIHKLFHTSGGGLNYKPAKEPPFVLISPAPAVQSAWVVTNATDVEWTITTANDLLLTAFGIEESICAKINEKITGSTTIPVLLGAGFADRAFAEEPAASDLTAVKCAACEGFPALCVTNDTADRWYFYSIIGSR